LLGFALAMGIYYQGFMGITLTLVSLGACIYFLYIAAKARKAIREATEDIA